MPRRPLLLPADALTDPEGNPVEAWITKTSDGYTIRGLNPDIQYTITENVPRDGYLVNFTGASINSENGVIAKLHGARISFMLTDVKTGVTEDGKILMVRQYRNALDRYTLEIPAGALDAEDEPGLACASRELEEETGYRSENLEWLITLRTTVAFCNERIEVYVAKNKVAKPKVFIPVFPGTNCEYCPGIAKVFLLC